MKTRLALSLLTFSFVTLNAVAAEDAAAKPPPSKPQLVTPTAVPGSEAFVYKKIGDVEMRFLVFKPKGGKATDRLIVQQKSIGRFQS